MAWVYSIDFLANDTSQNLGDLKDSSFIIRLRLSKFLVSLFIFPYIFSIVCEMVNPREQKV